MSTPSSCRTLSCCSSLFRMIAWDARAWGNVGDNACSYTCYRIASCGPPPPSQQGFTSGPVNL